MERQMRLGDGGETRPTHPQLTPNVGAEFGSAVVHQNRIAIKGFRECLAHPFCRVSGRRDNDVNFRIGSDVVEVSQRGNSESSPKNYLNGLVIKAGFVALVGTVKNLGAADVHTSAELISSQNYRDALEDHSTLRMRRTLGISRSLRRLPISNLKGDSSLQYSYLIGCESMLTNVARTAAVGLTGVVIGTFWYLIVALRAGAL
ncbi:hypothetical protein WCQ02_34910 [Paraburkholderia tropica]|uniref:Uncharacterized protein n=2 Tax=Paraburkholderia tropica TaxID=92647 RepID=A0ABX5MLS3_9BURK|nr:hypothetical protein C7400_11294 [Paraburkholderia tropica]PZW79550.1 hypothetical protein C7399_11294 [Paraburkholderia tropica]